MMNPIWSFGAVPLLLLGACSRPADLDGAEVAIPVYSPSRLEDHSEAWTSDDPANLQKYRHHGWRVSSPDEWEQVDQFYSSQPGFTRDDGDDPADVAHAEDEAEETPGQVVYRWLPPGWTEGEGVWVTLSKAQVSGRSELHISQDRLARR